MSPKTPRDVSGKQLVKLLTKYGYEVVRQAGSHIRLLYTKNNDVHNVTIPNHESIRLGTLMSIISDVSDHLKIDKSEIIEKL